MRMNEMLPLALQTSYISRAQYPVNLISSETTTYKDKLQSYRKRLDDAEADLCLVDGEDEVDAIFEVPIIDMSTDDSQVRQKRNIHTPSKLTEWLGVTTTDVLNKPNVQHVRAAKRDPKCRFIYVYGENSRDKLKITRASLVQILTYHQVMPVYLDFMLIFGAQINAKDPRFFGFREQIRLKNPRNDHIAPKLGRSGKMFQLCFNLKGVGLLTNNSGDDAEPSDGSIRTVSIYHRFDVEHGTSLWIVTKGGRDLLDRYKEITGPDAPEDARCFSDAAACFRASLSVHLMFCHWSTEDWQGYISWLENHLDYRSDLAYHYSQVESTYELGDIADLQYWRDNANQAVLLLNANIEILNSLRKFYVNLTNRADFPTSLKADCEHDLEVFLSQLDEIMKDLQRQLERARLIINIVNDRKELVLQHLQAQTEQLNRNMGREAAVMRIITIVTLLYLPSTFVSTFFSSDVVKYQNRDATGAGDYTESFSSLALKRWLQVTLPLTAFTLFCAWLSIRFYDHSPGDPSIAETWYNALEWIKYSMTISYTQAQESLQEVPRWRLSVQSAIVLTSIRIRIASLWAGDVQGTVLGVEKTDLPQGAGLPRFRNVSNTVA